MLTKHEKPRSADREFEHRPPWRGAVLAVVLACAAAVFAACDMSVINPGPVQDEFLDDAAAHEGMVNGMGRMVADAVNFNTLVTAAVAHELTAVGNIVSFGISLTERQGILTEQDADDQWNRAHQARWTAEDGIRRMREAMGEDFDSYRLGARALLYAAYANRLLGENFCTAIFDGGPPQPRSKYFERSLGQFDEALQVAQAAGADELALAARAGRASVRAWLGDWEGAVSDAEQIPHDFEYHARMTSITIDEYNRVFWAVANQPYRTVSVWNTFYEDYYLDSGDPRTAWDELQDFPYGDSGDPLPFYRQRKYTEKDDGIALASGDEMRLLIAEAELRSGDWQRAMQIVNAIRAEAGVEPWSASDAEEAWARLKRERGIELWLEGRRLWDIHRWREAGTPGANPDDTGQDTCFPVSRSERVTNPNL